VGFFPYFFDFPVGALLNASHRAHQKTGAMLTTMVVNIFLNAILVPRFGPLGAAWAGVMSFWLLYIIVAWFTQVEVGGARIFIWMTIRSLFAAGISWYAWRVIAAPMSLVAAAVFGGAVALLMAFIVRFLTVEDVYRLLRRFRSSASNIESIHES
jgi:O-antigen/teichoic acid export membrane protein